ncbi:MAG: hypothetical protein LBR26_16965, partial [Prevotella sp.]|nr:hypothetical protein [Prevotella sp.]
KYYKYKVGNVTSTPGDIIVNAYLDKAINKDWGSIPCADDNTLPTGRDKNSLSGINPENYQGDICKYLSDKWSTSGLISKWRMPVSDMFEVSSSTWESHPDWSGFDGSDANGASRTEKAFKVYTLPTGETVYFPASGIRSGVASVSYAGLLGGVGVAGGYWSSSAYDGTEMYSLYFFSGNVSPAFYNSRPYGQSVRCVRLLAGE